MNIETVNELIASLESAGELSIKETKYLEALKEFRLCSVLLDVAVKVANDFDRVIMECKKITGCPAGVDLQDHLRQLAAENVGLKAAFDKPQAYLSWHAIPPTWEDPLPCGEYLDVHDTDGHKNSDGTDCWPVFAKPEIETPATDRIYAGIKAEGAEWIEGNEPSEFGRYWVRYETDIGPQYCSAQWMEYNFCASSDTNIHKIWLADHSRSINSLKGVTHYTKLPAALEGGAL